MKLHEVPNETNVQLRDDEGNVLHLRFHYIDGAYGICSDSAGNAMHIAIWSDVEVAK